MLKKTLCLSAAAVLMSACGGSSDGPTKFSLAVTDAPVDSADAVVVKFKSVELRRVGGGGEDQVFDPDSTVDASIDLLLLQGDQSQFLIDGVEVPPGEYKIKFGVAAAEPNCRNLTGDPESYVQVGEQKYPITVGAKDSDGAYRLTVPQSIVISAGGETSYTVDFDLRRALTDPSNSDCYKLNPTALRIVDNLEVGALEGTIDDGLLTNEMCTAADSSSAEGYSVFVFKGEPELLVAGEELTSALLMGELGNFTYQVGFLPLGGENEGSYTAALACNAADGAVEFLATVSARLEQPNAVIERNFSASAP